MNDQMRKHDNMNITNYEKNEHRTNLNTVIYLHLFVHQKRERKTKY